MKKAFVFVITVFMALVLFACTPSENSAVAYRIVHKDYVGVVNVVVDDDVITDVAITEYYLPYTWAKVAGSTAEGQSDVVVVAKTNATTQVTTYTWYAKYIVIGDKQFTGELRTETLVIGDVTYSNETVKYVAEGIADLFVWLKDSEANMQWYVEQLIAGAAYVAKDTFAVNTSLYPWNQGNGFTKLGTGYWYGASYPLGWSGNMDAIYAAVEGKVFVADAVLTQATNNPDTTANEAVWSIADAVSGATLTDFKDYYALIGLAYAKTQAE